MERVTKRSWVTNDAAKPEINESYQYFSYSLSRPVICTIAFRNFVTQEVKAAKVVPLKCGEGHKFTQQGVLRAPLGFDPLVNSKFKRVRVKYSHSSAAEFNNAGGQARVKIFFRGFPLGTSTEEIRSFFSNYGKLEYLYIMATPKAAPVSKSIQGYIIFGSNDQGYALVHQTDNLFFNDLNIVCQVYHGQKTKKKLSESKTIESGKSSRQNRISNPDSSSNSKYTKNQGLVLYGKSSQVDLQCLTLPTHIEKKFSPFDRSSQYPPSYRKSMAQVVYNTIDQTNLRFNICRPAQARIPNWDIHHAY